MTTEELEAIRARYEAYPQIVKEIASDVPALLDEVERLRNALGMISEQSDNGAITLYCRRALEGKP